MEFHEFCGQYVGCNPISIGKAAEERISELEQTLRLAKEKLVLYRELYDGKYVGGVEYTSLMRKINDALE